MKEKIGAIAPFGLRMPSKIKAWVETKAAESDRSMNWVILRILEKEMERSENKKSEATA